MTSRSKYLLLLAMLAVPLAAPPAHATRYGDVDVSAIGGETAQTSHGYAPYRFRIKNDGMEGKRIGLTLEAYGDGISQLRREVEVPARASVEVVLHQPAEAFYAHQCKVAIDGNRMADTVSVSALGHGNDPRYFGGGAPSPGFILTSNRLTPDERDRVSQDAAAAAAATPPLPVTRLENATAALPVAEWPTDWLSLSRWDALALTHDEFEAMPPGVRAAVTDWVRAGGQLLVLRAGGKPMPQEWNDALATSIAGAATRTVGLGRVAFVSAGAEQAAGVSVCDQARQAHNPAVKTPDCPPVASGQVAVRGMFLLMLVFAIAVGPANYILCARKNKRIWMLWTSPLIALVFVAAVFAYALLSDGIKPWGRSVVVTLLDEKTHSAVTLGSTAWYAPMLPSEGLRFNASAEVRLLDKTSRSWDDRRSGLGVMQGATQQLTGGWMVPRYPESFGYRKVADSRLRMRFEKEGNDYYAINGLGKDVESLEVGGKLRLHCGRIPGGVRVKLEAGAGGTDAVPLLPKQSGDYWVARLSQRCFAELPFDNAKSHEVTETVIGKMEDAIQ